MYVPVTCMYTEDDQSILIETLSCNLQFFSELITTQLRDFHMVSPQVAFPLHVPTCIYLTMQSYKFYTLYKYHLKKRLQQGGETRHHTDFEADLHVHV